MMGSNPPVNIRQTTEAIAAPEVQRRLSMP